MTLNPSSSFNPIPPIPVPDGFDPTESRIISILLDGMPHSRDELVDHLYDDGPGKYRHLYRRMANIRKKLDRLLPGRTLITDRPRPHRLTYRLARRIDTEE